MFIFPTKVERITSNFRTKARPNHHGVDFAQTGTHEIVAIADGVVTRSYKSPSYGEVVFISHKVNGQEWESVYAHLREGSRKVRVDAKVKQDQVIGIMGNTGDSSGQHLHFELHKGQWNINKTNAVNPLDYLGKVLTSEKNGDSIVDYLNGIGVSSSFGNRAKLAAQHGIQNYAGTASQNLKLLDKLRNTKVATKPTSIPSKVDLKTNSIVDWMNANGMDSSYSNRSKLAAKYRIKNYKGTAQQNIQLLDKLRG